MDDVVQIATKCPIVHFVVSIECLKPEFSNFLHIFLIEDINTVWRPKQTMPNHKLAEFGKAFLPCFVIIE